VRAGRRLKPEEMNALLREMEDTPIQAIITAADLCRTEAVGYREAVRRGDAIEIRGTWSDYLPDVFACAALSAFRSPNLCRPCAVLLGLPWIDYVSSEWSGAIALNALIIYFVLAALSFLFIYSAIAGLNRRKITNSVSSYARRSMLLETFRAANSAAFASSTTTRRLRRQPAVAQ